MPNGFVKGLRGAIVGVMVDLLVYYLLEAVKDIGEGSFYYIVLIETVMLVASILVIAKMESWGTWYLVGWLAGTWIMVYSEVFEIWLAVLYTIIGLLILALRSSKS